MKQRLRLGGFIHELVGPAEKRKVATLGGLEEGVEVPSDQVVEDGARFQRSAGIPVHRFMHRHHLGRCVAIL